MNSAQLKGCRQMVDELHGSKDNGNVLTVRSAKEMALVPHNLSPMAMLADEPNGNRWGWSNHLEMWVLYEKGN